MGRSRPIFEKGLHFDLNYIPEKFNGYILHGCCCTFALTKLCPQTDIQTPGETLKNASLLVPATIGVSRTTFCHDDTHSYRLTKWKHVRCCCDWQPRLLSLYKQNLNGKYTMLRCLLLLCYICVQFELFKTINRPEICSNPNNLTNTFIQWNVHRFVFFS